MFDRRFFAELGALVAAAVLCAAIANVIAARERKLAWVGDYPNARVVPQPVAAERAADPAPIALDEGPGLAPGRAPATSTDADAPPPAATAAPERPAITPNPLGQQIKLPAGVPPPPRVPALADFPPHPDKPSAEISPDQAAALWRLKVPFLDARRSDAYRQGHIFGARSFPVWESDIDQRVAAFYEEGYPGDRPIVVYCTGGACEDSHMLAQKLWGLGFNNVLVYSEGWPDWVRRGLPVREGEQP
ncbi:MAG TPA: rhodanese-like domain-containing protein [Thermoanaerobaculia bacterium]